MASAMNQGIRRFSQALLSVAFLVAICTPGVLSFLGVTKPFDQSRENRQAEAWPELEWAKLGPIYRVTDRSLKAFPAQFDAFVRDRLAFRQEALDAHGLLQMVGAVGKVQASTPDKNQLVVSGQEGWLYLGSTLDQYRDNCLLTSGEMRQIAQGYRTRRDWLAAQGIRYLIVIAPNKSSIFPEYLPAGSIRRSPESKLDQFAEYVRRHTDLELLDLRGPLLEAKREFRPYDRTDTHWNQRGAFVGYTAIMTAVQKHFPMAKPWSPDRFRLETIEGRGLDLTILDNSQSWTRDETLAFTQREPPAYRLVHVDTDPLNGQFESFHDSAELSCMYMMRDSFAVSLIPYLANHWRHAIFTGGRKMHTDLIFKHRPELVIDEIVERKLQESADSLFPEMRDPLPILATEPSGSPVRR
jgi:hypothetical protein